MAKFKIEESKENSTYTVKKRTLGIFWAVVNKKNGEPAVFATKGSAVMFINHLKRLELKEKLKA
jgi:hypothetical protein